MRRTHHTAGIFVMSLVVLAASIAVAGEPVGAVGDGLADVAETRGEYRPPAWPEPPDTGAMFFRLVVGTFVALALCAGSLWFGRRWLRGNVVTGGPGRQLRVIETVSLGNRSFVHLVQAGKGQVLAGTDSAGLKALIAVPSPFEDVLADRIEQPQDDETLAVAGDLLAK